MNSTAAWVRCGCCGQWACSVHAQHVYECPCLPVEYWRCSPYEQRPAPCRCGATHEYGGGDRCAEFEASMLEAEG